jgi:hypothetical protein
MDSTGKSNGNWIQQWNFDWYMTIPFVDIKENPNGICEFIGWIQLDKEVAFGFNNGIWIGI